MNFLNAWEGWGWVYSCSLRRRWVGVFDKPAQDGGSLSRWACSRFGLWNQWRLIKACCFSRNATLRNVIFRYLWNHSSVSLWWPIISANRWIIVAQFIFHFPGVDFHIVFELLTSCLSERTILVMGHWRILNLWRITRIHYWKLQVLGSVETLICLLLVYVLLLPVLRSNPLDGKQFILDVVCFGVISRQGICQVQLLKGQAVDLRHLGAAGDALLIGCFVYDVRIGHFINLGSHVFAILEVLVLRLLTLPLFTRVIIIGRHIVWAHFQFNPTAILDLYLAYLRFSHLNLWTFISHYLLEKLDLMLKVLLMFDHQVLFLIKSLQLRFLYILQLLRFQSINMYRLIDGFLILLLVLKTILNLIFLCVILQNQLIQLSVFVLRFEHLLLIYV